MIGALARYQEFWKTVGLTPPVLVGLTLTGIKGWKVLHGPYEMWDFDAAFDRDVVNPQEVVLSDLAAPADAVLRPLFDFVWCGGGWPGSPNYRENWTSRAKGRPLRRR